MARKDFIEAIKSGDAECLKKYFLSLYTAAKPDEALELTGIAVTGVASSAAGMASAAATASTLGPAVGLINTGISAATYGGAYAAANGAAATAMMGAEAAAITAAGGTVLGQLALGTGVLLASGGIGIGVCIALAAGGGWLAKNFKNVVVSVNEESIRFSNVLIDGDYPLIYCAKKGYTSIFRYILSFDKLELKKSSDAESYVWVSNIDPYGRMTTLYEDINICDSEGKNCLYYIVKNGHIEIAKLLLSKFKDKFLDEKGRINIDIAVEVINIGDLELFNMIEDNLDNNKLDDKGYALITHAVINNNQIFELILKTKIEEEMKEKEPQTQKSYVDYITDDKGMTQLMHACRNADYKLAEKLIERGANVNGFDAKGYSPIMHATSRWAYKNATLGSLTDKEFKASGYAADFKASAANKVRKLMENIKTRKTIELLIEKGAIYINEVVCLINPESEGVGSLGHAALFLVKNDVSDLCEFGTTTSSKGIPAKNGFLRSLGGMQIEKYNDTASEFILGQIKERKESLEEFKSRILSDKTIEDEYKKNDLDDINAELESYKFKIRIPMRLSEKGRNSSERAIVGSAIERKFYKIRDNTLTGKEKYSFFTNNCASVVVRALNKADYDIKYAPLKGAMGMNYTVTPVGLKDQFEKKGYMAFE